MLYKKTSSTVVEEVMYIIYAISNLLQLSN